MSNTNYVLYQLAEFSLVLRLQRGGSKIRGIFSVQRRAREFIVITGNLRRIRRICRNIVCVGDVNDVKQAYHAQAMTQ